MSLQGCINAATSVMRIKSPNYFDRIKAMGFKISKNKIDYDKFLKLRIEYDEHIHAKNRLFEIDRSAEGVLAYIDLMAAKTGRTISKTAVEELGYFNTSFLELMTKFMQNDKVQQAGFLDAIISKFYLFYLGDQVELKHLFLTEKSRNQVLSQLVLENFVREGMYPTFKKYKLEALPSRIRDFSQSKKGKFIGSIVINLPAIIWELPYLILPNAKKYIISSDLLDQFFEHGMKQNLFVRLEEEMRGGELLYLNSPGITARYAAFKKYFYLGIGVYLLYYFLWDNIQQGMTYLNNSAYVKKMKTEIDQFKLNLKQLEQNGLSQGNSLYKKKNKKQLLINTYCEVLENCIRSEKSTKTFDENTEEDCRQFFDPENICQRPLAL